MKNTERVSYIRGLAEGLELDENKKEVKVLNAVIDMLDDLAFSMAELQDNVNDMADQLDAVDEDLGTLEDDFYDEDDEEDEDAENDDEDDDDDDDSCYYEVTCPDCHETVCLSEDVMKEGSIKCPNCGATIEFGLENEDGGEESTDHKNEEHASKDSEKHEDPTN